MTMSDSRASSSSGGSSAGDDDEKKKASRLLQKVKSKVSNAKASVMEWKKNRTKDDDSIDGQSQLFLVSVIVCPGSICWLNC